MRGEPSFFLNMEIVQFLFRIRKNLFLKTLLILQGSLLDITTTSLKQ